LLLRARRAFLRVDLRRAGFLRRFSAAFCAFVPKNLICFAVMPRRGFRRFALDFRRRFGLTTRLTFLTTAIFFSPSFRRPLRAASISPAKGKTR
jgi:hypothetical protein